VLTAQKGNSMIRLFMVVFFISTSFSTSIPGQAPVKCSAALTERDLMSLIKGEVPETRLRQYIETCGIAFSVTPDVQRRLISAGASAALIEQLKKKKPSNPQKSQEELQFKKEPSLWNETKTSNDPAVYEDFLQQYPSGTFSSLARSRLREIQAGKLRDEIPSLIQQRQLEKAEKRIDELLNLLPNNEEALNWRQQVVQQRQIEHKAANQEKRQLIDVRDSMQIPVAKNSSELGQLRLKGERNYIEFVIPKIAELVDVEDIKLMLMDANPKKGNFTLRIVVDDIQLEKKNRLINEPIQFLVGPNRVCYIVVINWVQKSKVGGYLAIPIGYSLAK
jgi:hypothetical protein